MILVKRGSKKHCCSSPFLPATRSLVLHFFFIPFSPNCAEQPHAEYSFSCDLPWHHLGRPFLWPRGLWLVEFWRRVSPAAVNSLSTASAHGSRDELSLPVWIAEQIRCQVNESTADNCGDSLCVHIQKLNSLSPLFQIKNFACKLYSFLFKAAVQIYCEKT